MMKGASGLQAVFFCCSLNAVRSPMAEGLCRHFFRHSLYVDSAGLYTEPLDPFTVAVMAEIGIDISDHNTQSLDDLSLEQFDLIIALSEDSYRAAQEIAKHAAIEVIYWPINNPTQTGKTREQKMEAYRATRDELSKRIREELQGRLNAQQGQHKALAK